MVSRFLSLACLAVPGADYARAATGAVQAPLTTSAVLLPDPRGRAPGAGARPPRPVSGLIARGPARLSFSFGPAVLIAFRGFFAIRPRLFGWRPGILANVFQDPHHPNRSGKQSPTGRCHRSRYAATV